MRARRLLLTMAMAAALAGAAPADAGWRSADRMRDDDRQGHDGGPEVDDYVPSDRYDGRGYDDSPGRFYEDERIYDDGRSGRYRDHGHHRRHDHRRSGGTLIPHTQPYWGTMRPYWNSPEPPGVIHRQPRTKGLRIERSR